MQLFSVVVTVIIPVVYAFTQNLRPQNKAIKGIDSLGRKPNSLNHLWIDVDTYKTERC